MSTTSIEESSKRKTKKESVSRATKSNKKKPLAAGYEKKKEQGESFSTQNTKSMKMVPPDRPFPKVYTTTWRRKLALKRNLKHRCFLKFRKHINNKETNLLILMRNC